VDAETKDANSPESGTREFPPEADFLATGLWDWPWPRRRIVRGANDEEGRLVPEFTPTRYELAVLATDYLDGISDCVREWEIFEQADVSNQAWQAFAERRLHTIESILGADWVREHIDPVVQQVKEEIAEHKRSQSGTADCS